MKTLIVEDDPHICDVLMRGLRMLRYDVHAARDGERGMALALSGEYSVIILDVKLPKVNGNDICRSVREHGLTTPIIMLSAQSAPSDIGRSMELGANAYIAKPFDFDILVDTIRSLTGMESQRQVVTIAAFDLLLDLTNHVVYRGEERIDLTAYEFLLLKYFVQQSGEVLTCEMICTHVLNMRFDPRSNVIDILVRVLQRKLDAGRREPLIEMVPGGFRFRKE